MDDNRVIDGIDEFVDEEWGDSDYENLEAPYRWRYDEATGKLHMLFDEGEVPKLVCSSAVLGEETEHYRIAVLASSQEVLLWHSNYSANLNASFTRASRG